MRTSLLHLCLLVFAALTASAQECPRWDKTGPAIPSSSRTLSGTLIYHDDLRQWFELKLDHAECGQDSIQLVQFEGFRNAIEVFRGCHVQSTGPLEDAGTGYFSLNVFQHVHRLVPDGICKRKPPFPDYSHARPAADVRRYRVEMDITYGVGDHPVLFKITSGHRVLRPWQAYASYWLTGGFGLYGDCAKGFEVDEVSGTPEAEPLKIDDATFQPESAAHAGVRDLKLVYTCVRTK